MKTSTVVVILVAILIIAGGAWWFTQSNTAAPSANTQTIDTANNTDYTPSTNTGTSTATTTTSGSNAGVDVGVSVGAGATKTVTVTYSASTGFSPKSVTINKGDTVKFVSESGQMWVGSDEHPSHTEYDGTSRAQHCAAGATPSFDQCSPGTSYSFTFTKVGTFDYHNHVAASQVGTVVVK